MSNHIPPPSTLPPGSLVWAYLRDSGGDAQEQSVPHQRAEVEEFCQAHGLILAHIFSDVAKSGGSVVGRIAFEDMIDMARDEDSRPAGLLIWNFARFARDLDDSSYYKALLRKQGLVIHSMTDPIPEGTWARAAEVFLDIMNEDRRRQISRDVKRALAAMTRQGFAPGGYPPRGYMAEPVTIGYKRDGKPRIVSRWVPDPESWDLVKLAWQMRADGRGYHEIQEATGGRLYKGKNCWTTFFKNKTYLGIGKFGELEVPDHHPAAVDQETWNRIQQLTRAYHSQAPGLKNYQRFNSPALFSGMAVCIHCGYAMGLHRANVSTGSPWPYYVCGKKSRHGYKTCEGRQVNARKAEAVILDTVLMRVLTPEFVAGLLAEVRSQMVETEKIDREEARIKGELREVERAIGNLLELAETFGAKSAGGRILEREGERARLYHELKQLEIKRAAAALSIPDDAVYLVLQTWREQIEAAREAGDMRGLRNLIKRFVAKVELGYNKARVHYTFPIDGLASEVVGLTQQEKLLPMPISAWGHLSIGAVFLTPSPPPSSANPTKRPHNRGLS